MKASQVQDDIFLANVNVSYLRVQLQLEKQKLVIWS